MAEGLPISASGRPANDRNETARAATSAPEGGPRAEFRTALAKYRDPLLAGIRLAQGALPGTNRIRPAAHADEITEYLDQPSAAAALIDRLPTEARLALSLLALTESTRIDLSELAAPLALVGAPAPATARKLLELGLLVIDPIQVFDKVDRYERFLDEPRGLPTRLLAHPAVLKAARTARPEVSLAKLRGSAVVQVREADGLEAILRLGALWQRVGAEPLRQTQQGTLYKRDRDRIADDPVLAAPVADELTRLPELSMFWLALAQQIGLIAPDPAGERLLAAEPEFWNDNAIHLPYMIATAWLSARAWAELEHLGAPDTATSKSLPYLRVALLLMLSTLKDSEWVAVDDLSALWSERVPGVAGSPSQGAAARSKERGRRGASAAPRSSAAVEAMLLGAAYPLGLVRAAEQDVTHKRLVQLSPLGRYVLALGATPPPRPAFDRFLLVQPNFEMIAYRQGLTPQLVGTFSRFAWWSQIGSAVELKLTRESIVHGLGGGLSAEAILDTLNRHNQRALPPGVVDAVKNWASRREWLSFYTSATLIEFGSEPERDSFLSSWQSNDGVLPVAVGERFLLVENERAVPFDRLRLTSSRDYRRPAEVCVKVESDGVTLALDLSRSDLLVDAELLRFADLLAAEPRALDDGKWLAVRRFRVTAASLARGLGRGMSHPDLGGWFHARTGNPMPPAIELLLAARSPRLASLKATREVIVTLPTVILLDGLIQHPATGLLLGERLGPFSVTVPEDRIEALQKALKELGIELAIE
jgi:hypothetical protein